jgi:membrane protein involved in D-alanine export
MYVYTFYLYFDFAGYSDMAIGTSYLLGIKAPENFNQPFLAKSMKELWERWHMSLSRWFGDYVFSRFVLNVLRSGMVKKQSTAARMGFFVTMTLMGCWHGFTLYYVIYGMYHGLALALTDYYLKTKFYRKAFSQALL